MPRQPRFIAPGQPQHVIVRGNNRTRIFKQTRDYRFFLNVAREAASKFDCSIHAYVLMSNHVHFLATPANEFGLSKTMQSIGRRYVQYFNKSYNRTGTLWEGRFKACLIDSEQYALTCYRYIELNPVRANMVNRPSEYKWSSYHKNAHGRFDPLVSPHELYQRLGSSAAARCVSYQKLFHGQIDEHTLTNIRYATNHCWVLGGDKFKEKVERQSCRPATPQCRGGDRRSKKFNGV